MTVTSTGKKFLIKEIINEGTETQQEVSILEIDLSESTVRIKAFNTDLQLQAEGGNVNLETDSDVNLTAHGGEVNIKAASNIGLWGKVGESYVKHSQFNADGSGSLANGNLTWDEEGNLD